MCDYTSYKILTVTVILFVNSINGANILFWFGLSTHSHRIAAWPLAVKLAESGHSVTFIQAYKSKVTHPKIQEFNSSPPFLESSNATGINFLEWRIAYGRLGTFYLVGMLPTVGYMKCEKFLESPNTKKFIDSSKKFDLVIINALFNECGYGLAAKWNAKTILFGTTHPFVWNEIQFGSVPQTSWISEVHASFDLPMNFWQRLVSTILPLGIHYYKQWIYFPKLEKLLRDKLDLPNMPSLAEMERKTYLVLYNSHFSEELPRSLPPMFVPVGGMHCECEFNSTNNIPKEIQTFIENSGDDGFVIVTLGGKAELSNLPMEIQNIFYDVFRKTKTKFITKWNNKPKPKEIPPNVLAVEWVPQKELLASKHCRGIISHGKQEQTFNFICHRCVWYNGFLYILPFATTADVEVEIFFLITALKSILHLLGGLLSMQEAVWFGIPMIVFPFFAEQDYNGFRLHRTRRGIKLEISTVTFNELDSALTEILTNPIYKENMVKTSKLFRDRPLSPVDNAVYWTEYILRHEDTTHLKPIVAMEQYWWQLRLLDVWAFIFIVIIMSLWLLKWTIRRIIVWSINLSSQKSRRNKKIKAKKN